MRHFYSIFVSALVLMGCLCCYAQPASKNAPSNCEVWGQIVTPGDELEDGFSIELVGKSVPRQRSELMDGNFDFRSVPPGPYQFRVIGREGQELFRRTHMLTGKNEHIILVAPFKRFEAQAIAHTISFRELSNQTPRRARSAFRDSEKAIDGGQIEKSIQYLEKAIAIDPQFAEAHVNLAAEYLQVGRVPDALQHFESAFHLSPGFPEAAYDFAMLLIITEKYQEAEVVARRALGNQDGAPGMHALLAVSLIWQHRNLDEAYRHLRRAANFPVARLLAANALATAGRLTAAAAQVREYLSRSAHRCERKDLEGWLARLDVPGAAVAENQQ